MQCNARDPLQSIGHECEFKKFSAFVQFLPSF